MIRSVFAARFALAAGLVALSAPAFAHTGHATDGAVAGFVHPLLGLDHVLAMLAAGVFAARKGGAAHVAVPGAFMAAMLLGGALAVVGPAIPAVETGIALSVALLGLAIVWAERIDARWGAFAAGIFGLFHGAAHGAELADATAFAPYAIGFLAATGALHAAGIALARMAASLNAALPRQAGAAIFAAGAVLLAVA
ncbi:MAG: HupE/UreJ family protein [Azospirillum sp.]|nr:HupE/UreJ family protein [Azospirillum sp.]